LLRDRLPGFLDFIEDVKHVAPSPLQPVLEVVNWLGRFSQHGGN
jgi:hypothetical protein